MKLKTVVRDANGEHCRYRSICHNFILCSKCVGLTLIADIVHSIEHL